jgi:hypothetical protein
MAQRPEERLSEAKMDPATLYREEVITDRKVGTLRVLTPIKTDGTTDAARPVLYTGEAQILTGAGPLPIGFEIEAKSLSEAVENFGPAAKEAIERTVHDLQEMRRQAASSIVVPQGGGMGGLGPGGMPGGKIQIP